MEKKRVLIVLNPRAGKMEANKHFVDIIDIFCQAGFETRVETTRGTGDGTRIVLEAIDSVDLIVAIGGDGTFNEVVAGIMESGKDTPLGYIPAGSTNDFATSLGLEKDLLKAAETITTGKTDRFDVGNFNGRYFSYVASFGAFTRASYEAPQSVKNNLGHLAYILEGMKSLTSIKGEKLKIVADDRVFDDEFVFGAISNSTSMGGILTLNPTTVDMRDGKFEVMLIKSPSNLHELNQLLIQLSAQDYNSSMITFFSAEKITVYADEEMAWTLDGEYQRGASEIHIENIPKAINIILPGEKLDE
ncbi:MAG: YegS/Rv2252/BmrU family lipid kinase [Clostridia bacterium]|nr:YegS/Rv2252/BmrU family lipid kinase [Clostridia bacterium]